MVNIRSSNAWGFPTTQALGVTAEELKIQQARADKNPALSPMAEARPVEFLNPSVSSEQLRLQTPVAANPLATSTGPLHDHINIRGAMHKSRGEIGQQLLAALQASNGLPEDRKAQIRASLSRETAMFSLLDDVQKMQDQIYGRIIGSAEA